MVYNLKFEGSPREIGEKIARIVGERRVSVLLMDDMGDESFSVAKPMTEEEVQRFLSELDALAVEAPHVDDSREAMYTRLEGE